MIQVASCSSISFWRGLLLSWRGSCAAGTYVDWENVCVRLRRHPDGSPNRRAPRDHLCRTSLMTMTMWIWTSGNRAYIGSCSTYPSPPASSPVVPLHFTRRWRAGITSTRCTSPSSASLLSASATLLAHKSRAILTYIGKIVVPMRSLHIVEISQTKF